MKKLCAIVGCFAVLLLAGIQAQTPQIISYQGRVTVDGVNFDGSGIFRFALVDATGATSFWSNDGSSVAGSAPTAAVTLPVSKGLYSVLLGDASLGNMTALPPGVFQNSDVRLRVWFDDGTHGSQLLTPDQRIAAVAYAIVAGSVADGAITAAKIAPGAVGATQLSTNAVQAANVASGQVVKSVNGLTDAVTISAGPNVTLTPTGNTLTISADNPLANWPGSSNVITVGNITTGTWAATPLSDSAIASAANWNAKQAGNGTLTLLSGKNLNGGGDVVLATAPTITGPLLSNPLIDGPTDKCQIGNGYWWFTAVPYLRPNSNGGLAFDVMPKGASGGDCWIDICSTDVVANPGAFETLNLVKRVNGPCFVGANATGAGMTIRNLVLQGFGGNVGIGKPFANNFAPLSLLHLASDSSTDLTISSTGTGNFSSLRTYHARGTAAASTPTQGSDIVMFLGSHGYSAAGYRSSADVGILFRAAENFTDTAHGTTLSLQTTAPGTVSRVERLGVDVDITVATGNLVIGTAGKGLLYKSGANARAGNTTLTAGTSTVANTGVTANTIVIVSRKTPGGTLGNLSYATTAGVGFTITSTSAAESSVVSYQLIEAN